MAARRPRERRRRGGLFELVTLPEDVDEHALLTAAAARGVGIEGLALHRFYPGRRCRVCCSATAICPSRRSSRACGCSREALAEVGV